MICEGCPPIDYPTQETRCAPCLRRPKPGRLMCCVPFCKRTLKYDGEPGDEWICTKHLKLVNGRMRKLWNARKKRALDEDTKVGPVHELVYHRATRVWDKLKSQAIERAMGMKA